MPGQRPIQGIIPNSRKFTLGMLNGHFGVTHLCDSTVAGLSIKTTSDSPTVNNGKRILLPICRLTKHSHCCCTTATIGSLQQQCECFVRQLMGRRIRLLLLTMPLSGWNRWSFVRKGYQCRGQCRLSCSLSFGVFFNFYFPIFSSTNITRGRLHAFRILARFIKFNGMPKRGTGTG